MASILKEKLNFMEKEVIDTPNGKETVCYEKSTKHLTKKEMIEYTDRIRELAAQWLGLSIPDPKEKQGQH